ncbi:MAG: hypothetical protein M1828_002446 [Chrysothrix sp. TS-e1954]|nr:MAG: hypothetical protein M1828_002446 [Chrysothrix sp. TS-e1954]
MSLYNYLTSFLYSQLFETPSHPTTSFSDQTIVITGASSGLGLEAACHFARLHARHIILAVRDEGRGAAAAAYVRQHESTDPACKVDVWDLDLTSFASIKRFAQRVRTKLGRLDVVVQNAGVSDDQFERTKDGHEKLLQTHVLGPALLAMHLIPFMKLSSKQSRMRGRMTFCGSGIYTLAKMKEIPTDESVDMIKALDDRSSANMTDRYMTTKLLLVYLVKALADASPLNDRTNPVVNVATPGFARSNIIRKEFGMIGRVVKETVTLCLARSTEVGSRVLVDATKCRKSVLETHGRVLKDCKVVEDPGLQVTSESGKATAGRFLTSLWKVLEQVEPAMTKEVRRGQALSSKAVPEGLTMSWIDVS